MSARRDHQLLTAPGSHRPANEGARAAMSTGRRDEPLVKHGLGATAEVVAALVQPSEQVGRDAQVLRGVVDLFLPERRQLGAGDELWSKLPESEEVEE